MSGRAEPAPFTIARAGDAPRIVYDSPHSGRFYPASFVTTATREQLRWAEDAYVDLLLEPAPSLGIALLAANYPRAWLDLNRTVEDIDEALLDGPWPGAITPSEKTRRGLGLIRRFVVPGVAIYGAPLRVAEVQRRIAEAYAPFHRALDALIAEALAAHGRVWHVDWHSMKSRGNAMTPDGPGAVRADFVVSDREGRSASLELRALIVDSLRAMGYSVSVNHPYSGGAIVQRLGDPARGVHSVQVEINRRLYLDEPTVAVTDGLDPLRRDLHSLSARLAVHAASR